MEEVSPLTLKLATFLVILLVIIAIRASAALARRRSSDALRRRQLEALQEPARAPTNAPAPTTSWPPQLPPGATMPPAPPTAAARWSDSAQTTPPRPR